MQLEIHGHHLPGRSWYLNDELCDNVHVGVQVGREPRHLQPGDSETAVWTLSVELVERDGDVVDFRGPAVQGRRGERFVYLTWGNVGDDASFTMFRRAKLMLADLKPLLSGSDSDRRVTATVDLTDDYGGPRCARLRSPALVLTTTAS